MRVLIAVLAAAVLLPGCTALADDTATNVGNIAYSPPSSFALSNETGTTVSWLSEETGTTLNVLVLPNRQSGSDLIDNFGQQWDPSNYIDSWFQAGNRSDIVRHEIDGRTWLQTNVTGQDGLLMVAYLTADDQYLYQFFLIGDRSAVNELYPTYRSTLADADFSG